MRVVVPEATFHVEAGIISLQQGDVPNGKGVVLVAAAGTSDLPVAEEAACTAELMGNEVDRLYDVGVAGLHRLLGERARLDAARVIIVVAGMEGALPSVVSGLVAVPVIAVPTSIGYGASFGGIAALLGMLNSCASGVSVVNIDNGFGAAQYRQPYQSSVGSGPGSQSFRMPGFQQPVSGLAPVPADVKIACFPMHQASSGPSNSIASSRRSAALR